MPTVQRDRELKRRRRRRDRIKHLRARIAEARDNKERERLIEKLRKRSPGAPIPEK
jgi:hypothetical protein